MPCQKDVFLKVIKVYIVTNIAKMMSHHLKGI